MNNVFLWVIKILLVPLAILDLVSGIVGGIWLLILWDWLFVLSSGASILIARLFLPFPLMLAALFMFPEKWLREHGSFGKVLAYPFFVLSQVWVWGLMIVWIVSIFAGSLEAAGPNEKFPYLLMAYFVSVVPWAYMSQGSLNPEGMPFNVLFARLGAAFVLIGMGMFNMTVEDTMLVFSLIMATGFLLSLLGKRMGLDRLALV